MAPNRNPAIKFTQIFINNEFVNSVSGKVFPVINPSTGKKIIDVQEGDKADVDKAVVAAKAAFAAKSKWRSLDASKRAQYLLTLADLLKRDQDYIASLETLENGKPYKCAQEDVDDAREALKYYAAYADKVYGKTIPVDGDYFTYTRLEPVGVCGLIIPWNFPLPSVMIKLAPALAAGCVCVLKPAEQTPLTALYLGKLIREADIPPGVVNIVPGYGPTAGAAIAEHPDISKVAFTGSTEVGRLVQMAAGKSNTKRVALEMGGKCPLVVFPDVDFTVHDGAGLEEAFNFFHKVSPGASTFVESVDEAASIADEGLFFNMGQCCVATSRLYVHEDIYDKFLDRSKKLAEKRRALVGDPFEEGTEHGPQIDEMQFNKIMELIGSGKKEGARLLVGGNRVGNDGYFIEPTIFADVTEDMRIAKEEVCGPVLSILKFKTLEEALEKANNSMYGLAAGILTKDIDKAMAFASGVQAGTVWINTSLACSVQAPFGGFKMSGLGREMGEEGLMNYLEVKTITLKISPKK
uniref:Putative formyltetrahydrofolate dehydrogenase n=1 Tax=Ixodes ricinus TaxID=34613 RepID=A0A6B0VE80_IXORI